ncbi:hypothetical protein [Nitrosomonas aestuarii]|uniref:hypothetical protein n=1 Tax=Nitrosomonas aestuarii TaxID=52441 RepID=UPI000D482A3A|nr:hypothetical protein [Nitrosomonas aestuarii]PTN13001.1 hypothetical protein C8R11_102282 [Nitrosomonas aestuarii]
MFYYLLCLSVFPSAYFRSTTGVIKLHVELNHNGYHSPFAAITEGKTSHVTTMKFYTQYSACHLFSIVFVAQAMATENICN